MENLPRGVPAKDKGVGGGGESRGSEGGKSSRNEESSIKKKKEEKKVRRVQTKRGKSEMPRDNKWGESEKREDFE